MGLHEPAWHAGTFVASHNLATAWHRVCNDVIGPGCHAKAILCMGGMHESAVLAACMPPPMMGAPPPTLAPIILCRLANGLEEVQEYYEAGFGQMMEK